MLKILVVGSGGREHAMVWKLAQSPQVGAVFAAPGNPGTANEPKTRNVHLTQHNDLINFCRENAVDFAIIGPEAPLAAGIVDDFTAAGIPAFGPTQQAAQLESSKDFAKQFMRRHNIPTAQWQTFEHVDAARNYVDGHGVPIVVKADGLAAGKGVTVATTLPEAHAALDKIFETEGARVVIEDYLEGEEASFIVMCDGKNILPLAGSQDHKRLLDGDAGPNTGGMGAYSPAPVITADIHNTVMEQVILPTVRGMAEENMPFVGFLYAGLMIAPNGKVNVIEFNCRFGDPETQPVLSRLQSDFALLVREALSGNLNNADAKWSDETAVGVVAAAAGYPDKPRTGDNISGLEKAAQYGKIFHAGTRMDDGYLKTAGGRVLCAVGMGENFAQARDAAYRALAEIHFDGMQFRQDIGYRAEGR